MLIKNNERKSSHKISRDDTLSKKFNQFSCWNYAIFTNITALLLRYFSRTHQLQQLQYQFSPGLFLLLQRMTMQLWNSNTLLFGDWDRLQWQDKVLAWQMNLPTECSNFSKIVFFLNFYWTFAYLFKTINHCIWLIWTNFPVFVVF